jgi:subtilisin family serine protease
MCNQKLIGARYSTPAWGGDAGITAQRPWEFNSPRDFGGHGTHTASTAGGNHTCRPPARPPCSARQRHRAARAHRRLQGALVDPGRLDGQRQRIRPRGRDRPGCGRRCRCHQLLGQRHADQLPRPGGDRVPVRGRRGRVRAASAGNSGPTTSTVAHPARGHHRGGRHAQPRRPRLGDAGQWRRPTRRLGRYRRQPRRWSTRRRWPARRRPRRSSRSATARPMVPRSSTRPRLPARS